MWTLDPVWTIGIREKILVPPGTRTQHSTARSDAIIPSTLARLVVTLQPHLSPKTLFSQESLLTMHWLECYKMQFVMAT